MFGSAKCLSSCRLNVRDTSICEWSLVTWQISNWKIICKSRESFFLIIQNLRFSANHVILFERMPSFFGSLVLVPISIEALRFLSRLVVSFVLQFSLQTSCVTAQNIDGTRPWMSTSTARIQCWQDTVLANVKDRFTWNQTDRVCCGDSTLCVWWQPCFCFSSFRSYPA